MLFLIMIIFLTEHLFQVEVKNENFLFFLSNLEELCLSADFPSTLVIALNYVKFHCILFLDVYIFVCVSFNTQCNLSSAFYFYYYFFAFYVF